MTTSNNSLPRSLAVALALIFGSSAVQAAQVQVWLEAREFTPTSGVLMNVPMWGYSLCSANFASCDPATSPGPVITVPAGDGLTIYLSNALADPTSIQLVGQRNAPLPVNADPLRVNGRLQALAAEVGPGSTDSYSWAAGDLRSGTILYQSASHVQLQVQMGLYGAVEHDAAVAYDSSRLMVFSEVDAALHSPPSPANLTPDGYRPRVLLINGEPLANSVLPAISAGPNERVLLRMVNAGLANHAPELIGGRFEIVAEDGYPVPARHSQTATLLPAAKTIDALLVAPAAGGTFGMFDRMARVGSIPTPPPPPDVDPPTAPGTPAFSLVTASTATASWTAATDLVGVTAYDFSLDGINWTVVGNFLSVDLTGLTPSTLYTFYVRARDLAGNMGPASSDTFTTDVAPPDAEPPSSPGTPGFTNVTTSTATASWAAATDNMAVTAYDYSLDNVNWTALGNVLTVDLTGLTPSTPYTLYVRARDLIGNIGPASSGGFTTLSLASPVALPDVFYIADNDLKVDPVNLTAYSVTFPSPGVLGNDTDPQGDALRVKVGSVVPTIPVGSLLNVDTSTSGNKGRTRFRAPATNWVGDAFFSYIASEAATAAQLDSAPATAHLVHDQHVTTLLFHNPAGTASDRWDLAGELRELTAATTLNISIIQNLNDTNCTSVGTVVASIPLAASAIPSSWTFGGLMAEPTGCKRLRFEAAIPEVNGVPAHTATLDADFKKVNP